MYDYNSTSTSFLFRISDNSLNLSDVLGTSSADLVMTLNLNVSNDFFQELGFLAKIRLRLTI